MTNWDSLSSHQKLSLGVFIVIGASAVILWPFLVSRQINLPFKRTGDFSLKSADQIEKERTDKLKTMDTDHDGLSDYDELYVYRTSPYLADSDSDGIPDGVEVAQDTDPNCPKGKTCRQTQTAAAPTSATPDVAASGAGASQSGGGGAAAPGKLDETQVAAAIVGTFGDPTQLTVDGIKTTINGMSASDVRAFLSKIGVPQEALLKADDATLRTMLTDTMTSMVTQPVVAPAPAVGGTGSGTNVNGGTNGAQQAAP